jgi:pyridoxamine 5'-phosphate oxidase-like protein
MPTAHLDPRFSAPGAGRVAWETVQQGLADADLYWVVTLRADGRPHATPLPAVVRDDVPHVRTGDDPGSAHVLAVVSGSVFAFGSVSAFGKGEPYGQIRVPFPPRGGSAGVPQGSEGA